MSQTRLYRNHLICNFLEQPPRGCGERGATVAVLVCIYHSPVTNVDGRRGEDATQALKAVICYGSP